MGRALTRIETALRAWGLDGYGGGILLCALLSAASVGVSAGLLFTAGLLGRVASSLVHLFLLYSLLALGDLVHHVWQIESAIRAVTLRARDGR